ncbi:MAG: hypothetical protein MZV70_68955 [Desulfobacterales bacterium]|nr:hypothetical protein [Desulfobacterales bacterium]
MMERILVVDDDRGMQDVLDIMLVPRGVPGRHGRRRGGGAGHHSERRNSISSSRT